MQEYIKRKQEYLTAQIASYQEQLLALPKGTLFCSKSGKYHKYYQHINGQSIYLSAKELPLIRQLALKLIITAKLEDVLSKKLALDAYISKLDKQSSKLDALLSRKAFLHELFDDVSVFSFAKEQLDWMKEPYIHSPMHPEALVHSTLMGYSVRSKTEVLIALALCNNNIPHRYECALELGNTLVFPSFTILHPQTQELIYWEHFREMDCAKNRDHAFYQLRIYSEYGILPGRQLITTFEDDEHFVSEDEIEAIIMQYFS